MIFKVKLISNANEINSAQQQNAQNAQLRKDKKNKDVQDIEIPKEEYKITDLLVRTEKISLAFINLDGNIQFKYEGETYRAEYDLELWNELIKNFK